MGLKYIFSFTFLLCLNSYSQTEIITKIDNYLNKNVKYDILLFVSIENQKMYRIQSKNIIETYEISTSKYGIGNQMGSNKTPTGLHKINSKYGHKTPINGRMIGRVFYGQIAKIFSDTTTSKTDDITSRILWLEGLENGINKGDNIDSYKRYIYIHGTSEEGRIGVPSSHGCVRMKNKDVIDLFNEVAIGTFVLIL
ncbi:MAG: L,D-transpeptidase family protein [Flavobacteriales bacterium]